MKKFIAILSGILLGSAVSVVAQVDQSKLPDQDNRSGYLSVLVDVSVDGGTGSVDVGPVLPAGTAVVGGFAHVVTPFTPAAAATNTAFTIQAAGDLKAVTSTLASAGLVALKPSAGSTFVTGLTLQTAPLGTNGNAVVTNVVAATGAAISGTPIVVTGANSRVTFAYGSAATQGVALVFLDLVKVQ
jgi:hypothetical protein